MQTLRLGGSSYARALLPQLLHFRKIQMKPIIMFACILTLAALSGCSGKAPVSVTLGENSFWNSPQISITALDEDVTVESVKINRGNCPSISQKKLPYKIAFGNSFKVDATISCEKVIEAEINTNKGSFTFTF